MGLFSKLFGRGSAGDDSSPEVAALIAQLDDADAQVRLAAAIALGELGSRAKAAVSKLEVLINDEDGDVCEIEIEKIGKTASAPSTEIGTPIATQKASWSRRKRASRCCRALRWRRALSGRCWRRWTRR